jgi:hypothetical protein
MIFRDHRVGRSRLAAPHAIAAAAGRSAGTGATSPARRPRPACARGDGFQWTRR